MSTRSLIAKQLPDGKIKSIYCYFGGYPSHVGRVLNKSYNTEERLDKLIALGWLISIHEAYDESELEECETCGHLEYTNVTKAYHRDEGYPELQINKFDSLDDFNKNTFCYNYMYLWVNGKWKIRNNWEDNDSKDYNKWYELTEEIIINNLPCHQGN